MERVTGIGGVFLHAREPVELAAWYAEHLGVDVEGWNGAALRAAGGETFVWASSPAAATTSAGSTSRRWSTTASPTSTRCSHSCRRPGSRRTPEENENARFAWANDPDGSRFELWQPPAGS